MGKKRRHVGAPPENNAAEFDMTPMIDVTFQLIVFFLVANDLSRKEIVDLELPQALAGTEDLAQEKFRVILNIQRPADLRNPPKLPVVKVKGQTLDLKQLTRELQTKASQSREPEGASAVYALIRADKHTPWQHVQYVMQICANDKIALYKLQFATTRNADGKATARTR